MQAVPFTNSTDHMKTSSAASVGASTTLTFSAVSHAPLRGLQVVDQELAAVAHRDRDAEEAAVLGAAMEELPGGTGRELADFTGPWQGGILQGEPHWSLCTTAIHLQEGGERGHRQKQSLPTSKGLLYPPPGLKVLIKPIYRWQRMLFFWQKNLDSHVVRVETLTGERVQCLSYLNTGGRHLRRLVVDPESVPARQQRVVTDQVLDGRVLNLCGVEVNAAIGIAQNLMASWVALWS